MSEQETGPGPVEVTELSDEQKAYLAQQQQAATAAAPSPAADQAATVAAMTERGPVLPAETEMDKLMAALRAQSEQIEKLQQQVGVMQKAADERSAAEGGPVVIRYAKGAADKLAATAVAHPDLGKDHFAPALEHVGALVDATTALHKGEGSLEDVETAAGKLRRFITVTHPRTGQKHVEGFAAILDDLETALDEAGKLAA